MASTTLRRIEELSLNSSAPPGQLLYDGWLLRLCPGKAKRARSVNAVYPSSIAIGAKVDYCERLYEAAKLPTLFRMTPFSLPGELEAELEKRGYGKLEPTAVESAPLDRAPDDDAGVGEMPLGQWIEAVGELRGSSPQHRTAHKQRLEGLPLTKCAVAIRENGHVVATGLTVVEHSFAGLFDIVTHTAERRRGHARRIVATLLARAHALGAREAYLQVEADNSGARRLYSQFGFTERYQYWYRVRAGDTP